jgi:hypothetical protein
MTPPPRTASAQELLHHGPGDRTSSRADLLTTNEDLEVRIEENEDNGSGKGGSPTKHDGHDHAHGGSSGFAGRPWPKWLDSPKKRRMAAGAALLPLVLIPLIVGPVVAAQNKKGGSSLATTGRSSPLSLASGGDVGLLPTDDADDVGTL